MYKANQEIILNFYIFFFFTNVYKTVPSFDCCRGFKNRDAGSFLLPTALWSALTWGKWKECRAALVACWASVRRGSALWSSLWPPWRQDENKHLARTWHNHHAYIMSIILCVEHACLSWVGMPGWVTVCYMLWRVIGVLTVCSLSGKKGGGG